MDKEKTYHSTDPKVLKDPVIKRRLIRIRNLPAPTPNSGYTLNHDEWAKALENHPDTIYKDSILRKNRRDDDGGWPVTANEKIQALGPKRGYPGTIEFWREALRLMEDRVKKGYFIGPFEENETVPIWVAEEKAIIENPIFGKLEIKPDGTRKMRLLADLSNNENGPSFNDCIFQEEKTVSYISIKDVIRTILDGELKWIWAMDALEAYYRVPIQRRFIRFMGVNVCGLLFFFTCLVMGMASACRIYTEFGDVIVWIITNNEPELFKWRVKMKGREDKEILLLLHYIDDFFGGAQTKEKAERQFEAVKMWWRRLNIPTQDKKC